MAAPKMVWGIDVGQYALKALKLRSVEGEVRLEAFDIIEYPKVLTEPKVDAEMLMRNALAQFLARNNLADCLVVVSAPGKSGITRFVKLPPVEPKQVPEIVRFEAEQQIPFDINEVIWRWQTFRDPDSPDLEVGIFAMKRPDVSAVLDRFTDAGINVDMIQMAPLALHNFMDFDGQAEEDGATLLADIGADKTDLVVADGPRLWVRTMQRGGNNFTEALVKSFKLSFSKAEKLKRTAATSKYARQIFQAMRPVFADLVQEIQRSVGYYSSLHRESRFKRMVALGNGFRLPGLQKFLEQNLNIPVVRVDNFNKLSPSAAVNAPAFTENVLSFAVAYGLALQGLGLTRIQTNLLPLEVARQRLWARKRPWFVAAAASLLIAVAGYTWRTYADKSQLNPENSQVLPKVANVVNVGSRYQSDYSRVRGRDKVAEAEIRRYEEMLAHNDLIEKLLFIVSESVNKVARHQRLMNVGSLDRLMRIERAQREVIKVNELYRLEVDDVAGITQQELVSQYKEISTGGRRGSYSSGSRGGRPTFPGMPRGGPPGGPPMPRPTAVPRATPGEEETGPGGRGFILYLAGTTPRQEPEATVFLTVLKNRLIEIAQDFPSLEVVAGHIVRKRPGRTVEETRQRRIDDWNVPQGKRDTESVLDPLTGEDASFDTQFVLGWVFRINEPGESTGGGDVVAAGGRR